MPMMASRPAPTWHLQELIPRDLAPDHLRRFRLNRFCVRVLVLRVVFSKRKIILMILFAGVIFVLQENLKILQKLLGMHTGRMLWMKSTLHYSTIKLGT
jgi:hypothetical protein